MNKLLLHCCCGPCAMYPISFLQENNVEMDMFWFNPNIHPEFEWNRRLENLEKVASHYNLDLIKLGNCREDYWLSKEYESSFKSRCQMCYDMRLDEIAKYSSENGYDSFTTTLLVSPYQQHDEIARIAKLKAEKYNTSFSYYDFREGFREGQNMARDIGLYRQKYCGCIFSLEESKFKDKILKSFEA